jgi:hypothetical protein
MQAYYMVVFCFDMISNYKMIEDRAMGIEKKLFEITERIRGNKDKKMFPKRRRFMFWVW